MAEASSPSSAALLLRPEPLEPDLDEEPPYFFRRIGEAAFAKFDGDGDDESGPASSSSALSSALARPALASVPAAGVVAYSSGSRESLIGKCTMRRENGRKRGKH